MKRLSFHSFKELKENLLILKANNDLYSYNKIINKLSSQSFKRIKFVGTGGGSATTQTHSLVKTAQGLLFEKIFNNESDEFRALENNYQHLFIELSKKGIRIPKLVGIYKSELIAICHFEFINPLIPLTIDRIEERLSYLKIIQSVHLTTVTDRDYHNITIIKHRLKDLLFELSKTEYLQPFLEIKRFIEHQKTVFTHGDYYESNVYENGIIDWDDAGFYPFGIDDAAVFYNSLKFSSVTYSFDELWNHLHIYPINYKINILFFYIIYEYKHETRLTLYQWIIKLNAVLKNEI